ncbi:uncharacterized protein G2W53_017824 [Senna tora]|uniref:MULE transposase domain-containing protein n=1 Tax=Senna tora TaxID=362788 RepID=A0A834TUT8_9FABA|nr:uncharacterized protein G2W53_017824 [Senna tora]
MPVIEICAQITEVLQDSISGDYIPEAPLQTVVSQEFLESQPAAGDDEYEGAITEMERLLSILTAAPNDDIGDEEYEDQLMGNDLEDGDYEEEDPNDYEQEDPYQYEEVDVGHVGSSSGTEFHPTPHQSQINLSGLRGASYDGDITGISTWTEDEDLRSGLVFTDKDGVQDALKLFSLKRHVDYRVTRSARKIHRVQLCAPRQGMQMKGPSKLQGGPSAVDDFQIRRPLQLCIHSNREGPPEARLGHDSRVVETVKKARGFTVSYKKAWRGKQKAIARVYGSWVASYNKLPGWMAAVQQAMPGTVVSFQTVDMPGDDSVVQFKCLFWAFKPCIDAWWQLKPMLQVDETFLYGKYKHSLLIAMGQDGNKNIVPVAFALVEGETKSAWSWFFWRLREHVAKDHEGTTSSASATFRNRVIRALLMKAGHEYIECGCQRRLNGIRLLNKDAADWIDKIPQQKWARAYDEGRRYGHMTTNLAECMNGVLKGVHCLPVTALVQATLYKVDEFFNNQRQQVQAQINTGHVLCEELRDTIFTNLEIARICKVTLWNEDLACADVTHEFRLYVDPVYKLETMLVAYSQPFHPVGPGKGVLAPCLRQTSDAQSTSVAPTRTTTINKDTQ